MEPWQVINGLRTLCEDNSKINVPQDVMEYISRENLAKMVWWPSSVWVVTERGVNYIQDSQEAVCHQ